MNAMIIIYLITDNIINEDMTRVTERVGKVYRQLSLQCWTFSISKLWTFSLSTYTPGWEWCRL